MPGLTFDVLSGHHAGPCGYTSQVDTYGYCLENNVVVQAYYLHYVRTCSLTNSGCDLFANVGFCSQVLGFDVVLILDVDIHQANGTREVILKLIAKGEKWLILIDFHVSGPLAGREEALEDEEEVEYFYPGK